MNCECVGYFIGYIVVYFYVNLCCFSQIDANVQREIINHRPLRHPNIVRFKEV